MARTLPSGAADPEAETPAPRRRVVRRSAVQNPGGDPNRHRLRVRAAEAEVERLSAQREAAQRRRRALRQPADLSDEQCAHGARAEVPSCGACSPTALGHAAPCRTPSTGPESVRRRLPAQPATMAGLAGPALPDSCAEAQMAAHESFSSAARRAQSPPRASCSRGTGPSRRARRAESARGPASTYSSPPPSAGGTTSHARLSAVSHRRSER